MLCNSMGCSPPGPSIHGISLTGILEWVAISFSRESSQPRYPAHISGVGRFFTTEPPGKPQQRLCCSSLSCVWLFATSWTAACQASLSLTIYQNLPLNSCPLNQWCHPTISSSAAFLSSCLQSFPESCPVSRLYHVAKVLKLQLLHQSLFRVNFL